MVRDLLHKMSIGLNGTESVGDRQGRATQRGQSLGNRLFRGGEMQRGDGCGKCVGHGRLSSLRTFGGFDRAFRSSLVIVVLALLGVVIDKSSPHP